MGVRCQLIGGDDGLSLVEQRAYDFAPLLVCCDR
jgi:hypothetical protein